MTRNDATKQHRAFMALDITRALARHGSYTLTSQVMVDLRDRLTNHTPLRTLNQLWLVCSTIPLTE